MRKKFKVRVNGKEYVVEVEELEEGSRAVQPVVHPKKIERKVVKKEEKVAVHEEGAVVAPMPGKITQIKVSEGKEVKRGEIVVMLEAMKMENEISAPKNGIVKEIKVKEGDNVNRGDALMIIE